ncbi:hypothetical protein ACFXDI_52835, partial [Streptomyces mirabilis]
PQVLHLPHSTISRSCPTTNSLSCSGHNTWYNEEHRHSGIGLHTPYDVHFGLAEQLREMRADVLQAVYAKHPELFVRKPPEPPKLPAAAWINQPAPDGPLIPAQR